MSSSKSEEHLSAWFLAGFIIQQSLIVTHSEFWLQLSNWVLIVSQYEIYIRDVDLDAVSRPSLQFVILSLFFELLWSNAANWVFFAFTRRILIGLQIGDWEVKEHSKLNLLCIYHIVIWSELKYLIGGKVQCLWKCSTSKQITGSVFGWGKTRCNGSSSVPTWTQNRTANLELLLTPELNVQQEMPQLGDTYMTRWRRELKSCAIIDMLNIQSSFSSLKSLRPMSKEKWQSIPPRYLKITEIWMTHLTPKLQVTIIHGPEYILHLENDIMLKMCWQHSWKLKGCRWKITSWTLKWQ